MLGMNNEEKHQKNRKIFSVISIGLFVCVLVFPTIIWGIGMIVSKDAIGSLDYDLGEKREKALFPEQFSADYGIEIEAYYNDRLPFRSVIITANRKLTSAMEKPYNEIISPYLVKTFYNNYGNEQQVAQIEETTVATMELEIASIDEKIVTNTSDEIETISTDMLKEESTTEEGEVVVSSKEQGESEVAETEAESIVAQADPNYMPPRVFNDNVIEGRDGWLFFAKENSLEDYLGINILSNEQMNEYLNCMLRLQNICDAQGKQLYFIIPPNKEIVYSEKMPSYTVADEYRRGARLVDYIHANSNIKLVYPIAELRNAKSGGQPYFRTDTHWNEFGAYVGVQALYSLMGIPTTDISKVKSEQGEFLGGDLITLGNLDQENYRGDIRYTIQYKPEIVVESVDGSQLNDWIYRGKSNSPNQSSVVVVGDSFRVFMGNYIARDFSSYTHVHWKYLDEAIAKESLKSANVIVIQSVERFNWTMINTLTSVANTLES